MLAIVGLILFAASTALFWLVLPKNGQLHRLATMKFVESIIPLGIVGGLAVGLMFMTTAFMR